jgi:hypothetical protein
MSGDRKISKITWKIPCISIKRLGLAVLSASVEKNDTFLVDIFDFDYRK